MKGSTAMSQPGTKALGGCCCGTFLQQWQRFLLWQRFWQGSPNGKVWAGPSCGGFRKQRLLFVEGVRNTRLRCSSELHPRSPPSLGDGHTEGFPRASHPLGDTGLCSPPPQRRHRARSLPVPRGRTATGGCFTRFALSAYEGEERFGADRAHSLLLSMSLLRQ